MRLVRCAAAAFAVAISVPAAAVPHHGEHFSRGWWHRHAEDADELLTIRSDHRTKRFGRGGPHDVTVTSPDEDTPSPPDHGHGHGFFIHGLFGDMVVNLRIQPPLPALDTVETPLPAALPLFATGLGVMGLLGWRRKKRPA